MNTVISSSKAKVSPCVNFYVFPITVIGFKFELKTTNKHFRGTVEINLCCKTSKLQSMWIGERLVVGTCTVAYKLLFGMFT